MLPSSAALKLPETIWVFQRDVKDSKRISLKEGEGGRKKWGGGAAPTFMTCQLNPVHLPPLAGAEGPLHERLQLPPGGFGLEGTEGGGEEERESGRPIRKPPQIMEVPVQRFSLQSQSALI